MTKIENPTTDEMKIPGAALASTIKVLAGLGSLGERVLKEHGVTKIDNSKEYPSHLRARIFEEIRTRFGKEALYAIGLEQGFLMLSIVPSIGKFIDDFRIKYKKELLDAINIINTGKEENKKSTKYKGPKNKSHSSYKEK